MASIRIASGSILNKIRRPPTRIFRSVPRFTKWSEAWQAIRRQLAAMANELYLVRLIHHQTGRPFPGERLWTAPQLASTGTIRFLRARNCEGCDVYIQPYAGNQDAASASRKETPAASQREK